MPVRFRHAGLDPASRGREAGAWIPAFAGMTGGYTASLSALVRVRNSWQSPDLPHRRIVES